MTVQAHAMYSVDYKNNIVNFNGHVFHHFYCPFEQSLQTCHYNENINNIDPCPYTTDVIHCNEFYMTNDKGNTLSDSIAVALVGQVFREG